MRARLRTTLAALAGLALLAALVAWAGPDRVLAVLRGADLRLVGAAVVCYAVFFGLRGWRWALLLRPVRPRASSWTTTHATAVGWLGNNLLPLRAGELVRAGLVSRREKIPLMAVVSTVAVERVLDVAGLALAAAISLLILPSGLALPPWAGLALRVAIALPLAALAFLALAVVARERVVSLLARLLRPLPRHVRARALSITEQLADGAQPIVRQPALLATTVPLTLAMTVAQAGVYALLVHAFLPELPVVVALAGAPWFILTFAVAFVPANAGTYEAAFAAIYGALGVPLEAALSAAILTHAATFLTVVLLGSTSIALLGAGPSALRLPGRSPSEGG